MAWALPLTGSSGIPSDGQNMRDSVDKPPAPRLKENTKKPSAPNSRPSATRVSGFGARPSSARGSPTGTSNRLLPLRAMRAG